MNRFPTLNDRRSNWWPSLWASVKIIFVLLACGTIAIFMITSTEPTETPVAEGNGSSVAAPTPRIVGPIPTPPAVAATALPQDVFVPGRLIYVKGRTLYMVHGYDAPVPLAANASQPSVSPDGTRLAYVAFFKNYQNLMLLSIQQRTSTLFIDDKLTDPHDASTGRTATTPSWSDDGKHIYFAWNYPGSPFYGQDGQKMPLPAPQMERNDPTITRCPASGPCDTTTAQPLTAPYFETGGDSQPVARPADPRYLVYAKFQYQQARDNTSRALPRLQALNLTDGSEVSLTDPLDWVTEPAWSANGRYLAFVKSSDDLQSSSIWIMAFHPPGRITDYAGARLLVSGAPLAGYPAFSPDGKEMAFIQSDTDGNLYLYVATVHFGKNAYVDTPREVKRANVIDGDELAWASS